MSAAACTRWVTAMPSGVTTYNSSECSSTWVSKAGDGMEGTNDSGEERGGEDRGEGYTRGMPGASSSCEHRCQGERRRFDPAHGSAEPAAPTWSVEYRTLRRRWSAVPRLTLARPLAHFDEIALVVHRRERRYQRLDQERTGELRVGELVVEHLLLEEGVLGAHQGQEGAHQVAARPGELCDQACASPDQLRDALRPGCLPRPSRWLLRPDWRATARRDGSQPLRRWQPLPRARSLATRRQSPQKQEKADASHARKPRCSDAAGEVCAPFRARKRPVGCAPALVRPRPLP